MGNGFNGKILRVDLTSGTWRTEEYPEEFYRTYLGGHGFTSYFLFKELKTGTDPFGPENKLVFAPGILAGSNIAGTCRSSVGAKSPLTGGYGTSEAGGVWPQAFKRTGYDALIIEGRAAHPVYLFISPEKMEIRDARGYWGKEPKDVQSAIRDELGDPRVSVAQIGVAGENRVRYATVANDLRHLYGRTGMGAVMGSKNLKAIAVKGEGQLTMADPDGVRAFAKLMADEARTRVPRYFDTGTAGSVLILNAAGGLPTRNFRSTYFEGAEKVSGELVRDRFQIKRHSCYGCPIPCKSVCASDGKYKVDPDYGGPEYETMAAFGSNCGVDDLDAVVKGNEMCNRYGIDTISAGVTISFAMECFERGILSKEDTGGLDLRFGNAEAMLECLDMIASRQGFGDILAEGSHRASRKIGRGSEQYAYHIKGQETPLHDPRFKKGLGLGYAISPTGSDHCHNIHDTMWNKSVDALKPFGILEGLHEAELSPRKVRLTYYVVNWYHFINCGHICMLTPWRPQEVVDIVKAVTGWQTSVHELLKVGERAHNLGRIFDLREGFSAADDTINTCFLKPIESGVLKGSVVEEREFRDSLALLYEMSGWNQDGEPTRGKLAELGIEWAAT
ncbi:MAG: aldehyde ferredoxin oxidoreductase family protein [Firmicutes bacterium]|nr:aldehyde ferredoxin oxidoreductase family protein [Bacillota bacterium]